MAGLVSVKIDPLTKENFDTWKIHVEALLIKNNSWDYVSGKIPKPKATADNKTDVENWCKADQQAKSDLILAISSSELKEIKHCSTSNEVWLRLNSVYQSKGPARKATLLKKLVLNKMKEGGDVQDHVKSFFDAVDKLNEMDMEINNDLLSILLLYSLPESFENFRTAIESRDDLSEP